MRRDYAIVDTNSFSEAIDAGHIDVGILFDNILESNMNTLRYSIDGSLFVIKTDTKEKADYLRQRASEENIGYTEYTYEDILPIMASNVWSDDEFI